MAKHQLRIGRDGTTRAIHADELQNALSGLGEVTLRRASRVDPGAELSESAKQWLEAHNRPLIENSWYAEMLVGSKEVLGPFATRREALDAEQAVLRKENIPLQ